MRILLFILIVLSTVFSADAQKKKDYREQIEAILWPANDPHVKEFDIPEKWREESAVIIYQKIYYRYETLGKRMVEKVGIRRRIKLLDQSAVEDYSEFNVSNPYNSQKSSKAKFETSLVALKIYKPDQSMKEVDMDKAVSINDKGDQEKQKIAIPNLEIGDILDFYYFTGDVENNIGLHYFPYINSTLSSGYSIMEQQFELSFADELYYKMKSCKGAPDFKKLANTEKKFVNYRLTDKDRAKSEGIRWQAENKEEPHIKFQAMYSPAKKYLSSRSRMFWGEPGEPLTKIGTKELIKRFQDNMSIKVPRSFKLKEYRNIDSDAGDKERLNFIYDYERYDRVMNFVEPMILIQEDMTHGIYDLAFNGFPTSWNMVSYMTKVCKTLDIEHSVIVTTPRENSTIDDLLLEAEVDYLLMAKIDGEEVYFSNWYVFSEFDQIPYSYEGAEALAFKLDDDGKFSEGKLITLPSSSHEDNLTSRKIELDLSDVGKTEFPTKRMSTAIGHSKDYYQDNLFLQIDFLEHEYTYHSKISYLEGRFTGTKKYREQVRNKYRNYWKLQREEQQKSAEYILENDVSFKISNYNKFEVLSTGRYDQTELQYSDEFTIDPAFLKKAGKNLIIPVGSLIEDQVGIKEDEMERSSPIYMSFPRSFKNEIVVTLPEGATVKGLDKLSFDVQNATGGFTSTANQKGNVLTVNTHKWYVHNIEETADWKKMVDFLEAAFQFSQQKILLER